jgi:hypothetical protein
MEKKNVREIFSRNFHNSLTWTLVQQFAVSWRLLINWWPQFEFIHDGEKQGRRLFDNKVCNLFFCWPYITVYQYSETNVMHFLFNLLRINGLYMFRALLAHPQEALHKRHLVYCLRVAATRPTLAAANWHNTQAIYQVPFVKHLLRMNK